MTLREWRYVVAMVALLPLSWWTLELQSHGKMLDSAVVGVAGVTGTWALVSLMRVWQD